MNNNKKTLTAILAPCLIINACSSIQPTPDYTFTLAVIPDTQNMTDFTRQRDQGFALDSSEIFLDQMRHIASKAESQGGEIAFVASVGDVWQHQTTNYNEDHYRRGLTAIENPHLAGNLDTHEEVFSFEIPTAAAGYEYISEAGIPFGVAPGNHDYDAIWALAAFPPNLDKPEDELELSTEDLGNLHVAGLANFRSVFGSNSDFFRDKDWYISAYNGGDNSAQLFSAGGYTFLHITLEMQAGPPMLAWAQQVIDANPGLPTIVTTHDYMNAQGERVHSPIQNLAIADPQQNGSSQALWDNFLSKNDQIFMLLCGHQLGQALRVDENDYGNLVYQILADYQERGQAGVDAGQALRENGLTWGIGDGWYRELDFDLSGDAALIHVKTYSSHYGAYSSNLQSYPDWYKEQENPELTDAQFYAADEYTIIMGDFFERYGEPQLQGFSFSNPRFQPTIGIGLD